MRISVLASIILTAATLSAKWPTSKIAMESPDRAKVEITGDTLKQFRVYDGAGTFINDVEDMDGFIADWSAGASAQPPVGSTYTVAFYAKPDAGERVIYSVTYTYDPARKQGYVYLPAQGQPGYEINGSTLVRKNWEGRWYRATRDWDTVATAAIGARSATAP